MANLSNINNKFLFTDGDFLKIGNLAPINNISGTESGISITNSNVASITLDNTAASGKKYVMYSDDGGKLNFYDADASSGRLTIDSSGNSTFSGKILVGTGATAAASLNAFTQTVSTNLYSALRIIENSGASSYWDIGATGGANTLLNFYHNSTTTPKISFTNLGGATFNSNIFIGQASIMIEPSSSGRIGFNRNTGTGAILNSAYAAFQINGAYAGADYLDFQNYNSAGTFLGQFVFREGEVGIGTDSPEQKLHVEGRGIFDGGNSSDILQIRNNAGGGVFGNSTNQFSLDLSSTSAFRIRQGSSVPFYLKSDGNVGIGTSSPGSRRLSVVKDTGITAGFNDITEFLDTTLGGGGSVSLNIGRANSSKNLGKMAFKYVSSGSNSNALNFGFYDADNLMTIQAGGNVGIGETSPASILHIKDNSAGPTQLSIQSNDFTRAEEINFLNPSTSAISGQIKYYTNPTVEYMSFSTSNNSAAVERMRITGAGALEIQGTATTGANKNAFITNSDTQTLIGSTQSAGTPKNMGFYTGAIRMSILSTGEVVIGAPSTTTISTDAIHSLGSVNRPGLTAAMYARFVMQERTGKWISFVNGTPTHYGTIAVSGSGVSYGSNSDYRLKENILDLTNSINKVKLLSPKTFNFIDRPDTTVTGFLAHEVQEIVSEAVTGEKDGTITTGNVINDSDGTILEQNITEPEKLETGTSFTVIKTEPEYQQLDQAKLVPVLIGALKELIAKVEKLENK